MDKSDGELQVSVVRAVAALQKHLFTSRAAWTLEAR